MPWHETSFWLASKVLCDEVGNSVALREVSPAKFWYQACLRTFLLLFVLYFIFLYAFLCCVYFPNCSSIVIICLQYMNLCAYIHWHDPTELCVGPLCWMFFLKAFPFNGKLSLFTRGTWDCWICRFKKKHDVSDENTVSSHLWFFTTWTNLNRFFRIKQKLIFGFGKSQYVDYIMETSLIGPSSEVPLRSIFPTKPTIFPLQSCHLCCCLKNTLKIVYSQHQTNVRKKLANHAAAL